MVIFLALCVLVWYTHFRRAGKGGDKKVETFTTTSSKLRNVKQELATLMGEEYKLVFNGWDENKIVKCVEKQLKSKNIPLTAFHMDGSTMADPVIDMYNKSPQVYKVLGECKFLDLIGRIVSTAAWVNSQPKKDVRAFLDCLETVDFTNIAVWKSISTPDSAVLKCI